MPGLLGDPTQGGGGLLGGLSNFLLNLNPSTPQAQAIIGQHIAQQQYQSMMQMPQFQGPGGSAMAMQAMQNPEIYKQIVGGDVSTDPSGTMRRTTLGGMPQVIGQQAPKFEKLGPGDELLNPYAPQAGVPQAQAGAPSAPAQGDAPPSSGGTPGAIQNNNGMLGETALQQMARQRLLGDPSVIGSAGMGALGNINKANLQNKIAQIQQEQKITPQEQARRDAQYPAYKKAVDKMMGQQAQMGQAGTEFQMLWPQFKADLEKYGATQYPSANAFFQFVSAHAGDPNVAPLKQRMTTLANVYGRATSLNPSSSNTDFKQREFAQGLNQYWNLGQADRIGSALGQEIQAAHDSVPKEINKLSVTSGLGNEPDPADVAGAKAAIARGAPKEQIIRRFEEEGFNAPKF